MKYITKTKGQLIMFTSYNLREKNTKNATETGVAVTLRKIKQSAKIYSNDQPG